MEYIIITAAVLVLAMYLLIAFSKGGKKKEDLKGKTGIALTSISDTEGKIKIDGKEYGAKAQNGSIPKSSKVEVKSQKGEDIVVEAVRF